MKNFKTILILLLSFFSLKTFAILNGLTDVQDKYDVAVKLIGAKKKCSGTLVHPRIVITHVYCTDANLYAISAVNVDKNIEKRKYSKIGFVINGSTFKTETKNPHIALMILEDPIESKSYPELIGDMHDYYFLMGTSARKMTVVGYGYDENHNESNKRKYSRSIIYDDFQACNGNGFNENLLVSTSRTNKDDTGGTYLIESEGAQKLIGVHVASEFVSVNGEKCTVKSIGVKLYEYSDWFKEIGLDVFRLTRDSIERRVTAFLERIRKLDINKQIEKRDGTQIGFSIKKHLNSFIYDSQVPLRLEFEICSERCIDLNKEFTLKTDLLNQAYSYDEILNLGERSDFESYLKLGLNKLLIKVSNGEHQYEDTYIDLKSLINEESMIKKNIFLDRVYFELELSLYDEN